MNYNKIISSAFSWISLSKIIWFLVFFWISLPVILFLPQALQKGLYPKSTLPIAMILYDVLYFALLLGVIVLIQFCLSVKHAQVSKLSPKRLLDLFVLVFVEFFYIFIWGVYAPFRLLQLLSIILMAFLYYYYLSVGSLFVMNLFLLSAVAYCIFVVYNAVRLFFVTSVFCSKELTILQAIKEATSLTHNRVYVVLSSIALSLVVVFVLLSFITICLGFVASLVLSYFFINPISLSFGFKAAFVFALAPALIAYQYSMAEVFVQLTSHKDASSSVKRILAHKVLHPKKKAQVRKLAKRKKKRR
jgi:hypothetical protein